MEGSGWRFSRQLHYDSLERMASKAYTLSHFQCWSEFQVMKALNAKNLSDWEPSTDSTEFLWSLFPTFQAVGGGVLKSDFLLFWVIFP